MKFDEFRSPRSWFEIRGRSAFRKNPFLQHFDSTANELSQRHITYNTTASLCVGGATSLLQLLNFGKYSELTKHHEMIFLLSSHSFSSLRDDMLLALKTKDLQEHQNTGICCITL